VYRVLVGAAFLALASSAGARVWSYRTVQLTDNDVQDAAPSDINALGDVVWTEQQTPDSDFYDIWAFVDGAVTQITDTPALAEWDPKINNAGWIAYGRNDIPVYPWLFSEVRLYASGDDQKISPPPMFPSESHWAPDINNLGEVVWHVSDSFSAPTQIYLYSGGGATNISDPTQAADQSGPQINDSTWVVSQGTSTLTGSLEVFLWSDGATVPITSNGYADGGAVINSLGQIAWVAQEINAMPEIALWDDGVTTPLTDDEVADLNPVISDSGAVAWSKAYGNNDDIWAWLPPGDVVEITNTPEAEWPPRINARNEIVYVRWVDGNNEIFVWSDGLERRLTTNDVSDINPIISDSGVIAWCRDDWNDFEIMVAFPCSLGDRDCDGDVDVRDYSFFAECMTGPRDPGHPGGLPGPGCEAFDFEPDNDVDLADFGAFQFAFTGSR
jgi:hypothetical protein